MNPLSQDSMKFLCMNKLDDILLNQDGLSKDQIVCHVADLRDEIDKFC